MSGDRPPIPSNNGLRTSFAIHSESSELNLLRLENQQLKELVIQLSKIVFKSVMDARLQR
jgi:hypothetical protein